MCRNIKTLYNFEPPATEAEIREAALQYVRKVSGFQKPSRTNRVAFLSAVDAIAAATGSLFSTLEANTPSKDRSVEAAKTLARAARSYRFKENIS